MSAVDTLRAWGILRPDLVVMAAGNTGLELAAAAALLGQESSGGHNAFGHDDVPTGGAYVKGADVTRAAYEAYRAALGAGKAGQQGIGPCQLTSVTFQDRADAIGGCWDPVANMRVGFALLATYAKQWGMESAFRAYNGGAGNRTAGRNANADRYAQQAMERYRRWVDRLGPDAPPPTITPEDDMQQDERAALFEVRDALRATGFGKGRLPGRSLSPSQNAPDDAFGWILTAAGRATDAASRAVPTPEIDYAKLAAALIAAVGKD